MLGTLGHLAHADEIHFPLQIARGFILVANCLVLLDTLLAPAPRD